MPADFLRIWIVDDDRSVRFVLATALREAGYAVDGFENAADALAALEGRGAPDLVFTDVRMPGDDGLQLLQRLRDEAHRFANTYNAVLRSKKIRESVLDDFPGLGPVRRAALLAHFGSIDRLRAATPGQIGEVEGLGPKLAMELHAFLAGRPTGSAPEPSAAPHEDP